MSGALRLIGGITSTALLAGIIGGCGSSSAPSGVPAATASQMRADLALVGRAASGGENAAAIRALSAFAAEVTHQHDEGHLTAPRYRAFETGIARAQEQIGIAAKATPARTTPATIPQQTVSQPTAPITPAPAHPGHDHGHGAKPGHGHGVPPGVGHDRGKGHGGERKGHGGD